MGFGITSVTSALDAQPDAMETALRLRLEAKDAILQSVVEDRIARANNTRIQQYKPEDKAKLKDGSKVDLWREPDTKDDPGWRGPCELIKVYADGGRCVVDWRGHVMLVPLRHVRPHIGFVWWTSGAGPPGLTTEGPTAVQQLMKSVEASTPFQIITLGLVWSAALSQYVFVPEDLATNPPKTYTFARAVASHIGLEELDGIQFGTQVKRTNSITGAARGRLLTWHNAAQTSYRVIDVNPLRQNALTTTSPWQDSSFVMFFTYAAASAPADIETTVLPDLSDVGVPSPIPWTASPWSMLDELDDDGQTQAPPPTQPPTLPTCTPTPSAPPAPPQAPAPMIVATVPAAAFSPPGPITAPLPADLPPQPPGPPDEQGPTNQEAVAADP